jgi:6-phosphogluconolactonase
MTMTLPAICAAKQVWILASGEAKATAVRLALTDEAGPLQVPAAGARGRVRTLFCLDEAAASGLPPDMGRPSA